MSLIGCLLIACTSHPHRHYPVLLRQLPDISHTPSRHPTDIPRHMGEKELADQNESNQIFINSFHIIPPTTQSHPDNIQKVTQTTSDTSQTSSRNPTDTRKAGTQWPIRVIGRRVNSQLKQYSLFFHWSFISWSGMIILQAVLRITQTPSWYLSDTFQTPSNLLMLALWRASVGKAVVEYDDTKWVLTIVIPSIQSWQYPGPIWQHPETLQTPSKHYPITLVPRT